MSLYYEDDGIRLFHGDNRENMEWTSAQVMITDPPYGMSYVSGHRKDQEKVALAGDKSSDTRDAALKLWGNRPALVFGTWRVSRPPSTRQVITWHKTTIGPGMGDLNLPWGTATEEIYVIGSGWIGKRRANYIATSDQRGNPYGAAALVGHPTPKPVGLLEQLIQCAPPGIITDPFAGGGSTLLAARNLGRFAIGVEIEERYCEIIAKRLQQGVLDFDG